MNAVIQKWQNCLNVRITSARQYNFSLLLFVNEEKVCLQRLHALVSKAYSICYQAFYIPDQSQEAVTNMHI